MDIQQAPPPIPMGCICAYTWAPLASRLVRNGPLQDCRADHATVDGRQS